MVRRVHQGDMLSPLLLDIFFASVITVALLQRSRSSILDMDILADLVQHVEEGVSQGKEVDTKETSKVTRKVCGVLSADDAAGIIVSRSTLRLTKMMVIRMEVCAAYGLTVSKKKMGTMHMFEPHTAAWTQRMTAAGQ